MARPTRKRPGAIDAGEGGLDDIRKVAVQRSWIQVYPDTYRDTTKETETVGKILQSKAGEDKMRYKRFCVCLEPEQWELIEDYAKMRSVMHQRYISHNHVVRKALDEFFEKHSWQENVLKKK